MKLSQIRPINQAFLSFAVPNQGSLIIYHRGRLFYKPFLSTKDGAGSPLSESQQQPSVTISLIEKLTIQIKQIASRRGRVAKQFNHPFDKVGTIEVLESVQKKQFSKKGFWKCFLQKQINKKGSAQCPS